MSRSICILLVALAFSQAVVATDAEPREIKNLELTKLASPTTDSFNGERGSCSTRFFYVGQRRSGDTLRGVKYEYNNNKNVTVELTVPLTAPSGNTVHFVAAMSQDVQNVVFCETPQTLGSSKAVLVVKLPPHSKPHISFAIATH